MHSVHICWIAISLNNVSVLVLCILLKYEITLQIVKMHWIKEVTLFNLDMKVALWMFDFDKEHSSTCNIKTEILMS